MFAVFFLRRHVSACKAQGLVTRVQSRHLGVVKEKGERRKCNSNSNSIYFIKQVSLFVSELALFVFKLCFRLVQRNLYIKLNFCGQAKQKLTKLKLQNLTLRNKILGLQGCKDFKSVGIKQRCALKSSKSLFSPRTELKLLTVTPVKWGESPPSLSVVSILSAPIGNVSQNLFVCSSWQNFLTLLSAHPLPPVFSVVFFSPIHFLISQPV